MTCMGRRRRRFETQRLLRSLMFSRVLRIHSWMSLSADETGQLQQQQQQQRRHMRISASAAAEEGRPVTNGSESKQSLRICLRSSFQLPDKISSFIKTDKRGNLMTSKAVIPHRNCIDCFLISWEREKWRFVTPDALEAVNLNEHQSLII